MPDQSAETLEPRPPTPKSPEKTSEAKKPSLTPEKPKEIGQPERQIVDRIKQDGDEDNVLRDIAKVGGTLQREAEASVENMKPDSQGKEAGSSAPEFDAQLRRIRSALEEEFGFLLRDPKIKQRVERAFSNIAIVSPSEFKELLSVQDLKEVSTEEAEVTGAFIGHGVGRQSERIVVQEQTRGQEKEYTPIVIHEAVHMLSPEPEVIEEPIVEDMPEGYKSVGLKATRIGPVSSLYHGMVPTEYQGTLDEKLLTIWEPLGVGASKEELILWEAATDYTARQVLEKVEPGYTPLHGYSEQSILTFLKVSVVEKSRLEAKEKELGRRLTEQEKEEIVRQTDQDFSHAIEESLVLGSDAFKEFIDQIPKESFLQRTEALKENLEKGNYPLAKRVPSRGDFSSTREDSYGLVLDWVGHWQKGGDR